MIGILYGNSFAAFLVITVLLGGAAAWMTGRAIAGAWQPVWKAIAYMIPLTAATRFLHYALAKGDLVSLQYFLVGMVILSAIVATAWRITRTSQLANQYPWLYERTSPFSVREIGQS